MVIIIITITILMRIIIIIHILLNIQESSLEISRLTTLSLPDSATSALTSRFVLFLFLSFIE